MAKKKKKKKISKKKTPKQSYRITNYMNTRSIYVDGQTWEVPKNGSIVTNDKEVADEFEKLFGIDVVAIGQSVPKTSKKKVYKKAAKKKVAKKKKTSKKKSSKKKKRSKKRS